MLLSQDRNGAMLDKLIRPANSDDWRVDHLRMQMLHHRATKSVVQNVVFNRANHLDAAGEELERSGIDRFDPARVDQSH